MDIRHKYLTLILVSLLFIAGCDLPGEISGNIVSEGKGLPGVQVRAVLKNTDDVDSATTDENGHFKIESLTPGEYVLTPSKSGYTFEPESYTVVVVEVSEENSGDATVVSITDRDFVATITSEANSNGTSLYAYDEDLAIFDNQPSTYSFAYNDIGSVKSVSRDVGQDGTIDSVDYYYYDEFGLLDRIERDSDNNRNANELFDYTRDPAVDDADAAITAAETAAADAADAVTAQEEVVNDALLAAEQDAAEAVASALQEMQDALTVKNNATPETLATATSAYNTKVAAYNDALAIDPAADATVVDATDELAALQETAGAKEDELVAAEDAFNALLDDDKKTGGNRENILSGTTDSISVYIYDEDTGALLSEELDVDADGIGDSTSFYNYDDNGNIISTEYNDDNDGIMDAVTTYTYDENNNVTIIERDDNYDGVVEAVYLFSYDADNNITLVSRDDGADGAVDASNIYSYDINGILLQIEQDASFSSYISNSIGFFNIELY